MRLILHTVTYWLMLEISNAFPLPHPLASSEFVMTDHSCFRRHDQVVAILERSTAQKGTLLSGFPQLSNPLKCKRPDRA